MLSFVLQRIAGAFVDDPLPAIALAAVVAGLAAIGVWYVYCWPVEIEPPSPAPASLQYACARACTPALNGSGGA